MSKTEKRRPWGWEMVLDDNIYFSTDYNTTAELIDIDWLQNYNLKFLTAKHKQKSAKTISAMEFGKKDPAQKETNGTI